jgi:aspartyl-tRNA(Asn)/glutamyl-tRNA(Gln) amidotransferase subunit A
MQLIGPQFQEARLLKVAHLFQQATDWHLRTPQADARAEAGKGGSA